MTTGNPKSKTLAAVLEAQADLQAARSYVDSALAARDAAISAAVAAGDAVIDVAYAARMNTSNVGRRVAASVAKEAAK